MLHTKYQIWNDVIESPHDKYCGEYDCTVLLKYSCSTEKKIWGELKNILDKNKPNNPEAIELTFLRILVNFRHLMVIRTVADFARTWSMFADCLIWVWDFLKWTALVD